MRDLSKDMEICEAATPGPWHWNLYEQDNARIYDVYTPVGEQKLKICRRVHRGNDATFIAAAREGWPHAIERAMMMETTNNQLADIIKGLEAEVKDEVRRCNEAYFDRAGLGIKVDQLQAKLAAAEKVVEAAREYLESQDYHAYMACSSSAVSNRETLKNIADRRGLLRQALAAYEEGAE